jgi:hypothetical protein
MYNWCKVKPKPNLVPAHVISMYSSRKICRVMAYEKDNNERNAQVQHLEFYLHRLGQKIRLGWVVFCVCCLRADLR